MNLDAIDNARAAIAGAAQKITEDAEELQASDPELASKVETIIQEAANAGFSPVRFSTLLSTIKSKTPYALGTLREMVKVASKGRRATVRQQDIGERVARETLNRYYSGGNWLVRANGQFWGYTSTHWLPRSDEQVAANIMTVVRDSVRAEEIAFSSAASQALSILRADRAVQEDVFRFTEDPLPVQNYTNGELWMFPDGTTELRQHSPESRLTYCRPFAYDPDAKCPLYDQTLLEIFGHSTDPAALARHWNEASGYFGQPRRWIPAIWILKGFGSNGKSRLMKLNTDMLGPDAVASVRVESIDTQFGRSGLLGKLLMVDDDVDAGVKLPDGILKQISERKRVSIEFKGRTAFDAVLNCAPVLLCNNFPVTSDVTHGMLRRIQVIPFLRQFRGDEIDPTRFDRIQADELPGVANRHLEGWRRLCARGRFDPPRDCLRAAAIWLSEANPLQAFIDECLVAAPADHRGPYIKLPYLYRIFTAWADESGVRHITARKRVKANLQALGVVLGISGGVPTIKSMVFSEEGLRLQRANPASSDDYSSSVGDE